MKEPGLYEDTLFEEELAPASFSTQGKSVSRNESILPKIRAGYSGSPELISEHEARYEALRALGKGGIGEVDLVRDNDIRRLVARKRIRDDRRQEIQLMRFIEEIQTVGQLEHPNIVPIHDVGVDESGGIFFTMKYAEGETLKEIIDKLKQGDPLYHARFSFEKRTQIFIDILNGVLFAHKAGFVHRDIKPTNVMIGSFGEVMVMDWGSAKKIRTSPSLEPKKTASSAQALELFETISDGEIGWQTRVFQTQEGALVGTPAYMSPEQAIGDNDLIDERSDIYSLCVLFFEFLNLRHYLEEKENLEALFYGIVMEPPIDSEALSHPSQGPVPRELCFFLRDGLQKDPRKRFQSVLEMREILQLTTEGKLCVHCPSTLLKRGAHEWGHFLDNHRVLGPVLFGVGLLFMLFGVLQVYRWLSVLWS